MQDITVLLHCLKRPQKLLVNNKPLQQDQIQTRFIQTVVHWIFRDK